MLSRNITGLCMVLSLCFAGLTHAAQDNPASSVARAGSTGAENPVDGEKPAATDSPVVAEKTVAKKHRSVKKRQTETIIAPTAVAQSAPRSDMPTGYPVLLGDNKILEVSSSLTGELTPEQRAALIQQNIQTFADSKADANALKLIKLPEGYGIGTDASILMVITNLDAGPTGKSPEELARQILGEIQIALTNYRTKHNWKIYSFGAAYSFLSIVALWLALRLNNWVFRWLVKKVSTLHDHWKGGIHLKGIEVISAHRIERIVLLALKSLRIFVILLFLYFFLPLILSFFPETHALGSKLLDYLISPFVTFFHTIIRYIPNFFYIFVIIVIAKYVLKVIAYVFNLIERGELEFEWFYDDWARPTYQIVRFLVIVTALISAYPYIPGSSSQAFQGVGLVLGAIISFASSSAISNIVAGVILTYTRAFRLGDRIKVGETTGDVVDKTLLVTRVQTIKSVIVTIPNSLVMSAQIINFSTSADEGDGVILHTSVTIGYDIPWKQVRDLLVEAAKETKNILEKPEPFVLQTALNDFYVSYEINAYTKTPKYMAFTYSELHKNILDKFDAAGVEIMSPHYYALRDGNASAVPSILNAEGYTAPSFRVGKDVE
ncbi:MAG: mechanosensitive ion channel domain-containing protein [Gallionella sp.]